MSNILGPLENIAVSVNNERHHDYIARLGKALSSVERVRILQALSAKPMTQYELSVALGISVTSVSRHLDVLEDARLTFINHKPGPKGHMKLCGLLLLSTEVTYDDPCGIPRGGNVEIIEMPIGLYRECKISAPCGINGADNTIGAFCDPSVFFLPESVNAENLWFETGYVKYYFPLKKSLSEYALMTLSFEICSECVNYNNDWPSDITLTLNDNEIVTFTSPRDFGGKRGKYTPDWWPVSSTQFGLLKTLTVDKSGVTLDHLPVKTNLTIDSLAPSAAPYLKFGIGVKEDVRHRGGVNLFGKNFGNYPQAIIMTLYSE